MNRHLPVLLFALSASAASAAELNSLSALSVVKTPTGAQVVVQGTKAPTFTVFRLNEPDRLVVDLSQADGEQIKGRKDGSGPVMGVVASQFKDDRSNVSRLLVTLEKNAKYDVRADGNRVVISIDAQGEKAASATPAAKPVDASLGEAPRAEPKTEVAVAEEKAPAAVVAEKPAKVNEANSTEPGVVASRVDEKPVKNPAQKITAFKLKNGKLQVLTDGEIAKFELIELADPPRLAVDVFGVKALAKPKNLKGGALKEVRIGAWPDKVRLVLDVDGEMPVYSASRLPNGVSISLDKPATAAAPKASAPIAVAKAAPAKAEENDEGQAEIEIDGQKVMIETAPKPERFAPKEITGAAEVKDLTFEEAPQGGRVELKLAGESTFRVERPDAKSAVLTLETAHLPKKLERSLDTTDLETPIKMVSAFAAPGQQERVRVVVAADSAFDETVVKTPAGLSWRLRMKGAEEATVNAKTAGFSSDAKQFAESGAPQRRYVGKKVSFEFKDIDIHNLLRIIAEISKKNIVVADDVTGKVTIRLRNVPWDQALELILRSKGLGQEDLGNIIRVAPLATLESEAKLRAERRANLENSAPITVQLIPVNYATAEIMSTRVKEVLTKRGHVTTDERTNTLIVGDIAENMGKIRSMVAALDTQTPQVLIESRIVEANTRFQREVGIQWGGNAQMAPNTNNATGLAFPNNAGIAGGSDPNVGNQGVGPTPGWAVNLPVGVGSGSGAGVGMTFGSAGGALQLNLRLSALENQGVLKTISAPKVTTLDNSTARISQGLSIPFSQVSAAGVNTVFVEARLQLEVTPHITADGSVLMKIVAQNNQPDPSSTGANGQPAIQRKEANTQVLVHDADTTVIGGIYVRQASNNVSTVPILGKIPVLGYFFRNNRDLDVRNELLIFITPRILNHQPVAQNP